MTDAERDDLIEKSLLQELDTSTEARVQQLRRDDDAFRQEYDFQETLIQQVQLNRRQEMLRMFAGFEIDPAGSGREDGADTTPVIPLPVQTGQPAITTDTEPTVIPLWRQTWFRVAATLALAALLGIIAWRQLSTYDPKPIASDHRDSTKIRLPKDSLPNKRMAPPSLPPPEPQGPIAQQPRLPNRLQGPTPLRYYETDNISLGFGKETPARTYRTVIFGVGSTPEYEFQDTLKVYLPARPSAKPAWSLVYDRTTDTYYLLTGNTRYEIIKGLQGRQPLAPTTP